MEFGIYYICSLLLFQHWFQLKISGDVFYLHRIWILHLLLIIIIF
jgi:hypothetical protein